MRTIFKKLSKLWGKRMISKLPVDPTGLDTANHIIFNLGRPMKERLGNAMQLWHEHKQRYNYLLTGEAFFAAQCWLYSREVYLSDSPHHDPDICEYIAVSRELAGGDRGWEQMLAERVPCSACGMVWRLENIHYCVACMRHICPECGENHIHDCGDHIVG